MQDDELVAAGRAWAKGHRNELLARGFAQADLDELIEDRPALAVRTALSCLQSALMFAREADPDVDGMAVVPLIATESFTRDSPPLGDVLTKPWQYGPGHPIPGLYLVARSHWREYEAVEEYRRHLESGSELPDGYAAYYRTWRSADEAAQGWEYQRAIHIRSTDRSVPSL